MKKKFISSAILAVILIVFALTGFDRSFINKLKVSVKNIENGNLEVHFLDVGQADSAIILCDGEAAMIDGGNAADSSFIVSYLKKLGIEHLRYMFCSHPHEDHVGGLSGALNQCSVDYVFCSEDSYDSKAFENFKKYTEKQGKSIIVPKAGDTMELGQGIIEVTAPVKDLEDTNNNSLILRLTYGENSFLFAGDAEYEEEKTIDNIKADVLKVPHHGSDTSSSYSFIRNVMPQYVVISVGKNNSYSHPSDSVISRYKDAGSEVFRTDTDGNIVIKSDGMSISVEKHK